MSDETPEYIREAMIVAAEATGATRLECPDYPHCRYAVTCKDRDRANDLMRDHLANSARHTGGLWIDRDGNQRRGLDYVTQGEP